MADLARAVAFLYIDNSVDVLTPDGEDAAAPDFISRMEFEHAADAPWDEVEAIGRRAIRDRIAILPDERWGSRGRCRSESCGAAVVYVRNPNTGRTPPYELDGTSHFERCPDADRWRVSPRPGR